MKKRNLYTQKKIEKEKKNNEQKLIQLNFCFHKTFQMSATSKALFYIEKGLAYTNPDGTLITNILVVGVGDNEIKINELKETLYCFGEIKAITFNDAEEGNAQSANVLFKSPTAAAEALLHEDYDGITVKPNDSWLQPIFNRTDEQRFMTQTKYLTDLNDDIILEVISYLELKDQLALVCSSDRFLCAFEMFAQLKLKEVTSFDLKSLSKWQTQQFFYFAGVYIEQFRLTQCSDAGKFSHACYLLTKNCPNLKMLSVSRLAPPKVGDFNKLLSKTQNLKHLLLYDCTVGDNCLPVISALSQLEELTLTSCDYIRGYGLMIPNLKELNISSCEGLKARRLRTAISEMTQLTTLSLGDWCGHLSDIIQHLPQICQNIEVLYLDCPKASYHSILKMDNLRTLSFLSKFRAEDLNFEQDKANRIESLGIDCRYLGSERRHLMSNFKNLKVLRYFSANDNYLSSLHELQKLESINLDSCDKMTNNGLLELVKCCQNLKYVNLTNTNINTDFADALLPWLQEHKRTNGQLQFYVCGSRIQKHRLSKEYFTPDMKTTVKFIFERLKPNLANNNSYRHFL